MRTSKDVAGGGLRGGRPKKSLGQHFLTDVATATAVVTAGRIGQGTRVVEVGPGRGFLTRRLLEAGAEVLAIEKDSAMAVALPAALASPWLTVIEADFLAADLGSLEVLAPAGEPHRPSSLGVPGSPAVLVGNLPYNVSLAILARALDERARWARMVFMFQLEVAVRVVAGPGSRDYGIPSVMTALTHEARIVRRIPPGAFFPAPKVHSALVCFEPLPEPLVPDDRRGAILDLIAGAFRFRRKTAANALSRATARPASLFASRLVEAGFPPDARLEALPPSSLVRICH
jgi:16S rRNA (adenine1518-N6/adenine1519-N6)-dimethyltransferase